MCLACIHELDLGTLFVTIRAMDQYHFSAPLLLLPLPMVVVVVVVVP